MDEFTNMFNEYDQDLEPEQRSELRDNLTFLSIGLSLIAYLIADVAETIFNR